MTGIVTAASLMSAAAAVRSALAARASGRSFRRLAATERRSTSGAVLQAGSGGLVAAGRGSAVTTPVRRTLSRLRASDPLGRARRRRAEALPLLADDLATALRSGSSVTSALREVAESPTNPVVVELRPVVARIEGGEPVSAALGWWADQADRDVGLLVAALSLGDDTGGSRARSVDRVAATLRERRALESEVRALSATARSSAGVLVLAPPLFTAFVVVVDPRTAGFLFSEPLGWACVAAGVLLDIAGAVWMSRITGGLG